MNTLEVIKRASKGRNACKQLRKTGEVPGVIYGNKNEAIHISLKLVALLPCLRAQEKNFQLKLDDGREEKVLVKEVQYNSLTDTLLHIDFQRIA